MMLTVYELSKMFLMQQMIKKMVSCLAPTTTTTACEGVSNEMARRGGAQRGSQKA